MSIFLAAFEGGSDDFLQKVMNFSRFGDISSHIKINKVARVNLFSIYQSDKVHELRAVVLHA